MYCTVNVISNLGHRAKMLTTTSAGKTVVAQYASDVDAICAVTRNRKINQKAKYELCTHDSEGFIMSTVPVKFGA
jgi:hypothetical protein